MRDDMREYWREPDFWRWWWDNRMNRHVKAAIVVLVAFACATTGFLTAQRLTGTQEAKALTTRRVVTVVRRTPVDVPRNVVTKPKVVTTLQTVTESGEERLVTVRRDGRTKVVR